MSTSTVDIPQVQWTAELTAFSRAHTRWLVSLEILSPELGVQPEINELPLIGITFEPRDAGTMVIAAGRSGDQHITHVIAAPRHVRIERTASGADAALEIESADGTKTLLRFRAAALTETVDGILDWP